MAATTAAVLVTSLLSVVAAASLSAAAVAAAAAESALTKQAIRRSLSWGWVGVSMDLGGMLPVRTLRSCVTGFRLDTLGWAELKAGGWLDGGCSRSGGIPGVPLWSCQPG